MHVKQKPFEVFSGTLGYFTIHRQYRLDSSRCTSTTVMKRILLKTWDQESHGSRKHQKS